MYLQSLWSVILLVAIVTPVIATPATIEKQGISLDPKEKAKKLEELHTKYKGIYFGDAAEDCSDAHFDTLLKTLDGAIKLVQPIHWPPESSPGWNRFFLSDSNVPKIKGWGGQYNGDYKNIVSAMKQVAEFPLKGDTKGWDYMTQQSRIAFRCTPLPNFQARCDKGAGAFTSPGSVLIQPDNTPKKFLYTNIVTFCPQFFTSPKYHSLDVLTTGPKKPVSELHHLATKESAMAHEFFHAKPALRIHPIKDLTSTVPELEGTRTMYGPELCARFAWKNTYNLPASSRALNPAVSENADSYTWFYIFNWFNKEFVWNSAGLWSWDKDHKRDVNQTEGDFGTNDWEDDPDNTMPASKINEDKSYPQANCQPVGGDPLNQDCAYLDEDYDDWVKAHPSATATLTVHRTEPAPPTKTSTTSVSCTPYLGSSDPNLEQCACSDGMVRFRNKDGSCPTS